VAEIACTWYVEYSDGVSCAFVVHFLLLTRDVAEKEFEQAIDISVL